MDAYKFEHRPREYALDLVTEGMVDAYGLLRDALNHMSADEVRDMLRANDLAPEEEEAEADEDDEESAYDRRVAAMERIRASLADAADEPEPAV